MASPARYSGNKEHHHNHRENWGTPLVGHFSKHIIKISDRCTVFNFLVHPVLMLILVALLLTILNLWMWWKIWTVAQQVHVLWTANEVLQKNLQ